MTDIDFFLLYMKVRSYDAIGNIDEFGNNDAEVNGKYDDKDDELPYGMLD